MILILAKDMKNLEKCEDVTQNLKENFGSTIFPVNNNVIFDLFHDGMLGEFKKKFKIINILCSTSYFTRL